MRKLIFLFFFIQSTTLANETWLCLMRTYYEGFDGTYMKQESVYDLAVTSKPEIWQYKVNWITNTKLGKVVESSYRKDPKINKSVFLLNKDVPEEIRNDVKRIRNLVFQKDKKGLTGN